MKATGTQGEREKTQENTEHCPYIHFITSFIGNTTQTPTDRLNQTEAWTLKHTDTERKQPERRGKFKICGKKKNL